MESKLKLGNHADWNISFNEQRILLTCKSDEAAAAKDDDGWMILSSAVLNGGLQEISSASAKLQLLNAKVPADYDGVTPDPRTFLEEMASREIKQQQQRDLSSSNVTTVGMMTAASMNSLRIGTRQACVPSPPHGHDDVIVDAIVTAGISNARAAGADADCFFVSSSPPAGTINTIILTDAILQSDDGSSTGGDNNLSPMMEAYAIAIEAKCRATADLGISCAKRPDHSSQGTGTDCCLLVAKRTTNGGGDRRRRVRYAGKHTLFGELIGQAVYQATRDAVLSSIEFTYRHHVLLTKLVSPLTLYRCHGCWRQFCHVLRHGHAPWVPSAPMEPVPKPRGMVLLVGCLGVLMAFGIHCRYEIGDSPSANSDTLRHASTGLVRPSGSILLAVLFWDRFLGGSLLVPVSLHPVVLTGNVITTILQWIPDSAFQHRHPIRGILAGCALLLGTLAVSMTAAWWCLLLLPTTAMMSIGTSGGAIARQMSQFLPWFLELYLVQSALSLQLLCSIALQMAHHLERGQIGEARARLSWLCSRDPSTLRSNELAAGTLESLSENLSDSLVSPLTYYVLLGPLGAFGFRVANTLDSRVGYRGGRYEYVGKPSARLDDLLNLFPARLTAVLLALAAWCLRNCIECKTSRVTSASRGLTVAWKDARQCDSPNAGWPMATMAGVLNVCLEKKGQYALNKAGAPPCYKSIRIGHDIALLAGLLAVFVALVVSIVGDMHAESDATSL
jgi:adenosylcobinamide-phosphate synthase